MKLSRTFSMTSALILALIQSTFLFAADAPLKVSAGFNLEKQLGVFEVQPTLFDLMDNEIKPALDNDYADSFVITDAKTFRKKAENFDHIRNLERKIKGGAKGLDELLSILDGQEVTMDQLWGKIYGTLKENDLFASDDHRTQSRLAGALAPIVGLASGQGVLVQLDSENYVYHFGYAPGSGGSDLEADKTNRKSGRSYGASIGRNAYDPSDNDYLRGLAVYVNHASAEELESFYRTVFELLLKSDPSRIQELSEEGQLVIADFMAIYMAELDRHLMTGLKRYEWENALTEITMLAAFSTHPEGMTLDPRNGVDNTVEKPMIRSGELPKPKDRLLGYFGVGTDGSGLDGRNKQRRHKLSRQVVRAERKINKETVARIEEIIGARSGSDIYDYFMNFVNNYKTQQTIQENADEMIDLVVDFVLNTRVHAAEISEQIDP